MRDVVEALDLAYRTTEPGKRLALLYRQRAENLPPAAWRGFAPIRSIGWQ